MTDWVEDSDEQAEEPTEPQVKVGPTGEYPNGKIAEGDKGELQFAVGVTRSAEVFLDFGTDVKWIALPPVQAIGLAEILAVNAEKAVRVAEALAKQQKGAGLVGADGKPLEE